LGKAKKSKKLAHKNRPSHPLIAQGFLSFFAVGIKRDLFLSTAKKPFPPLHITVFKLKKNAG
jgi:hypothetical protein